ncbi:MAG: Glutamate formimidoyltransferase [Syntrophus sp. SKADARSKE-3]|nr:Glutamate formimidoyltransferase [Syntrophus sp. SKADARSKE-3]
MKIIECVPNFSEGRDPDKVERIADAVRSRAGVRLLDVNLDTDHHRSVLTFLGEAEAVIQAALAAGEVALSLIDISCHEGVHPRIGAIDVVPFVPLGDAGMDDAVCAAHRFGSLFSERFGVPVYYYGEAALERTRCELSDIRRGGIEGLKDRIGSTGWYPDAGPTVCHEQGGAVAVGARMPLVAYNINLDSDDLDLAKAIARSIRESSGGLPYVKALGLFLNSRNIAQVSMNLTNFRETSIRTVFDRVQSEAAAAGVSVLESELIGLAPRAALDEETARHIRLNGFSDKKIIETYL